MASRNGVEPMFGARRGALAVRVPYPDHELARWVREALQQRRMSQRQLAHRSGVDHSTISRLLQGSQPTYRTAARLTRVLAASPSDPAWLAAFLRRDPQLDERGIARIVGTYTMVRRQS